MSVALSTQIPLCRGSEKATDIFASDDEIPRSMAGLQCLLGIMVLQSWYKKQSNFLKKILPVKLSQK